MASQATRYRNHNFLFVIKRNFSVVSESSQKEFYKAKNNEEEFNKKAKSLEGGYGAFR